MIKLLEAVFRRSILLLFILLVPIIIGVGIGYALPPSYQASATLWALQPYNVPASTGAGSTAPVTPADTQAAALTELLQSAAFDVAVGSSTDLKSTFTLPDPTNTQAVNAAYVADISKNVLVTSKGNDVYQISYANNDAHVAAQVVAAVIKQFQTQGQQFITIAGQTYSVIQAQLLLQGDQAQLAQAENDATNAAKTESAYLAAHPGATTNDPQYAVLDAKRVQAQSTLTNLQSAIATLSQQIGAAQGAGFFKTLDPPVVPTIGSRAKILPTTIGIGAAVGIVLLVVYILILVRRDRALYGVRELQKVVPYSILMQVPLVPRASTELVGPGAIRR